MTDTSRHTDEVFEEFFDALEIEDVTDGQVPDFFRKDESMDHDRFVRCYEAVEQNISDIDVLDQICEECAELTQAAQKMIRAIRGTNPTPVSEREASAMIREEASDLLMLFDLWDAKLIPSNQNPKWARWATRLTGEEF